jgi:hypothetical protein
MTSHTDDLERFQRLYAGYSGAHVQFSPTSESSTNGKMTGKYKTLLEPANEQVWHDHLEGKVGLGIIPLGDDGESVSWGCIDYDNPQCDHADLERRVNEHALPLVLDRSKSGGAHLVLHLDTPVKASWAVSQLREWAVALQLPPNVEIFPKQVARSLNDSGQPNPGTCLNLPYFGGSATCRYAIKDGRPLGFKDYLEFAESRRVQVQPPRSSEPRPAHSSKASEGRNGYLFSVGCRLRSEGTLEGDIFEALLAINREASPADHQSFANGSLDEREVRAIVKQVCRYAAGGAVEPWLDRLNQRYAIVQVGSKVPVLQENADGFELLPPAQFHQLISNQITQIGGRSVPISQAWLKHARRRQFSRIVFEPGETLTEGAYNLWRGFTVQPLVGDCSLFLAHLRDNVAQGNEDHYKYLLMWFAAIMQKPAQKVGTCVVLRGKMGSGKSFVGEAFGKLLGRHYRKVARADQVVGRFNSHLESCLLLQAEEAFWAGSHEAEGVIKDLITNSTQQVERKGIDLIEVANHVRLLVTSNADWVVPAGLEERRFAVFDVGEAQLQNRKYFGNIVQQLESGGYEALLKLLLEYPIEWEFLHTIPATAALAEQKVHSLGPAAQWMLDLLNAGYLPGDKLGNGKSPRPLLQEHYYEHTNRRGVRNRSGTTQLGMHLSKMFQQQIRTEQGVYFDPKTCTERKCRVYVFPSLRAARELFSDQQHFTNWDELQDWQAEPEREDDTSGNGGSVPF